MGELDFENILGEQEIETLFMDPEDNEEQPAEKEPAEAENEGGEKEEKNSTTEAVDSDTLFDDAQPESVGSGNDKEDKEKEDTVPDEDSGTSPTNFYSSIASALAVDGVFPNLDEKEVKKVTTAESFSNLIDAEVNARLDERQRRVAEALDNGLEASDIRRYENTLAQISAISDADISEEGEKGEQLRRSLIFQDFINKGYSREKAIKFTERTISAGTDVEDAKEALQSNKEYFQSAYNELLHDAQKKADAEKEEKRQAAEKLRNSIMTDKQLFGDMELSADLRKKVYENISKPIYRDSETGEYMTAIQKFNEEHESELLKYVGLLYTLTDGFKDFESFTKGKVKREMKKGLRELEHTLNSTNRQTDGSFRMVSNAHDDPESFIGKGMKLDL